MDVLDSNLKEVEAPVFRGRDFSSEVVAEVFVDDAIGSSEEGKNV